MRNLQRIIQCFKNFLSRVWITPFFSARHIWMLKTIPVMAPRLLIYNERYSCKWWLSLKLDSFFFLLRRAAPCSQTHVPVTGCGLDDVWKFETLSWASFVFRLTSNSAAKRTVLGAVLSFLFDRHMGVWLLLSHVIIHGIKKRRWALNVIDDVPFSLVFSRFRFLPRAQPSPRRSPLKWPEKFLKSRLHTASRFWCCATHWHRSTWFIWHGVKFLHHLAPSEKKAWNHRDVTSWPLPLPK